MTNEEKAKIILEAMDSNGIQINWNMEKYYTAGIIKGLEDIEKKENAIKKARAISMFIDKEEAK